MDRGRAWDEAALPAEEWRVYPVVFGAVAGFV